MWHMFNTLHNKQHKNLLNKQQTSNNKQQTTQHNTTQHNTTQHNNIKTANNTNIFIVCCVLNTTSDYYLT